NGSLFFCRTGLHGYVDNPAFSYRRDCRNNVFGLFVKEGAAWQPSRGQGPNGERPKAKQRPSDRPRRTKTAKQFIEETAEPLPRGRRAFLAGQLGLPPDVFDAIGTRWTHNDTYNRSCFLFPEENGAGDVIGYGQRYDDGSKRFAGQRGITVPDGW